MILLPRREESKAIDWQQHWIFVPDWGVGAHAYLYFFMFFPLGNRRPQMVADYRLQMIRDAVLVVGFVIRHLASQGFLGIFRKWRPFSVGGRFLNTIYS